MTDVVLALVPVLLLIVLGVMLKRTVVPDDAQWVGVERLNYFVLFPALIVATLATSDLAEVPVAGLGGAFFLGIVLHAAGVFAAWPWMKRHWGLGGPAFSSVFQCAIRWNTFIALAVSAGLYGQAGVALASVVMVALIPVINVMSVWVLARYASGTAPDWRSTLATIARNPLIWSCIIGLALNPVGAWIPGVVLSFGDILGRCALGLGLLAVGAGLDWRALARPGPAVLFPSFAKLVALPLIALGLCVLFGVSGTALGVAAICASVPTAANAYILARQLGGDAPLAAAIISFQTVAAGVTMPAVITVAKLFA